METNKERGKATSEITVVRIFIRNRNRTITTKKLPSNRLFFTLLIELSIKRLWRNMSVETCTSAGRFFCKSAIIASNFSVKSIVLVFGCLVTVINTAGFARSEAVPSFGLLLPIFTVAIFSNKTGKSPTIFTTPFPISSAFAVERTPLMMYSLSYS